MFLTNSPITLLKIMQHSKWKYYERYMEYIHIIQLVKNDRNNRKGN